MSDVTVSIDIDESPGTVWRFIEPIENHIEWMADAVAITFETDQTRGVGTRFLCDTKIGPVRLTDRMEITEWRPALDATTTITPTTGAPDGAGAAGGTTAVDGAMGVRHTGLVTGSGVLHVESRDDGRRTRFTWVEDLDFPWFFGGRLGEIVGGKLVLGPIWRRNLKRLKRLVEAN